jgi:hypothetical protein
VTFRRRALADPPGLTTGLALAAGRPHSAAAASDKAVLHLPLYLGIVSVLITTGWALVEHRGGSAIAFAGALLSTAAETWHASIHLRLDTRGGPIAEGVVTIGFLVVVIAVWAGGPAGAPALGRATRITPRGLATSLPRIN